MLHSKAIWFFTAFSGTFLSLLPLTSISQVYALPAGNLLAQNCPGRFIFYEGRNLTRDMLGEFSDCISTFYRLKTPDWRVPNDEARSVRMLKVRANTRLIVFDSPNCSKNDDWTEVFVKVDIQDRTVPSFEIKEYIDDEIHVVWHRKDGLDGKVSCVEVRRE